MNDRFKFRVWDGSEMHHNDFVVTATGYIAKIIEEFLGQCVFSQDDLTADNECILIQCTGLKDKNGKLIYEGDIVQIPNNWDEYGMMAGEKREIYFNEGGFRLKPKWDKNSRGNWLEDTKDFEVIGNIYENPELLQECE